MERWVKKCLWDLKVELSFWFLLILLQAFNTKNECLKGKISSYYYIPTLKSHVHTNGELWYWAFTFIDDGNKSWGSEVTIETPCRSLASNENTWLVWVVTELDFLLNGWLFLPYCWIMNFFPNSMVQFH